ncbi:MAG: PKD domain-containing protein, partial [Eudoraea sp.]|nr:PKD domain-containing protein [Eudoraea sp.]
MYLNGAFPSVPGTQDPYQAAFENLTFDSPLNFSMVPNQNKIVVGQRDGKVYWFNNDQATTTKNLLVDLSAVVGVVWDGGFLGLSAHPNFGTAGNNYFFAYYSTEDSNSQDFPDYFTGMSCNSAGNWGNFLVLERFEVNPANLTHIPGSSEILLKRRMYGGTHRGGGMEFGDDGFLYLTTGDNSIYKNSQDIINNFDGGVLRLDVDKDPSRSHQPIRTMPDDHGFQDEISGNEYWIPNDNPFLSPGGSNFEEYYTLGHRNPHRMAKDKLTGTFYIGEVGGNKHEEINVLSKGKNYGWPVFEGNGAGETGCTNMYNNMANEGPLVEFPRSEANTIIGGYVYRGNDIPELYGKYICADYGIGEEIWSVDTQSGNYELLGNFSPSNIISFGQDDNGEIYILKLGNNVTLYKLVSPELGYSGIPQNLSETGAFTNLQSLSVTDGLIPFELIDPFWSDGALKKRWMAIPNDGSHNTASEKVIFSENGVWEFPVGSVLVKHFDLPINDANPSITRKIETRFSVKDQNGEFYFLTYNWNNAQTDATLQEVSLDEPIAITTVGGGTRYQNWHFPSNSECVSCHNNNSKGTLGPRTRYLNKDYTYSKTNITANQLVTLSYLGILDQNINDSQTPNFLTHKSIDDPSASIDDKARSYLDLNCAYCHRPGTGNRAEFDLRLINTLEETGLLTAGTLTPIGIEGETILVPGDASKSILYHRTNSLDPNIMMPPLAKGVVDDVGVALIEEWINQLVDPNNQPPVAVISASPLSGEAPLEVTFTGSNSTDDTGVVSYFWDFGDGAYSMATNPVHIYKTTGEFVVELSV